MTMGLAIVFIMFSTIGADFLAPEGKRFVVMNMAFGYSMFVIMLVWATILLTQSS